MQGNNKAAKMKALVLTERGKISIEELPSPTLSSSNNRVLVQIHYASLNHRDVWITQGLYPNIKFPSILGADGAGVVVDVEDKEKNSNLIGQEVLICPMVGWSSKQYPESWQLLGLNPQPGTLADYIVVPREQVFLKPKHLSLPEAASLPLAGWTAYRAVFTKGEVEKESTVLITGIGGGVALFALLFSVAFGCTNVFVTSGCDSKLEKAISLGARGGANYNNANWHTELVKLLSQVKKKGFDAIIDGSGGNSMPHLIKLLNPGGKLVNFGVSNSPTTTFSLPHLFLKNAEIRGTSLGDAKEFTDMLLLIDEKKIKFDRIIDSIVPFSQVMSAFEKIDSGKQSGKLVIQVIDTPKPKL